MIAPPRSRETRGEGRHLSWPADRFYWAVLDGTLLPRRARASRRRLESGLGFLFESVLPGLAVEEVQAVYRPLRGPSDRYLACGVGRSVLESEVAPDAISLTPRALPAFIEEDGDASPESLNLLTGAYLPAPIRRARRRVLAYALIVVSACVALVVTGFERRVGMIRDETAALADRKDALVRQLLGPGALRAGGQPADLQLVAERRRLERTRNAGQVPLEPADCAEILARVLGVWPVGLHAMTETVSVGAEAVTIRARVASMTDAQRFAEAFETLDGWRLQQPQSEAQRGSVLVTVRLERKDLPP